MHFERLIIDGEKKRILEGTVAELGVWRGGRLLADELGKDDHLWVHEVVRRFFEGEPPPGEWRIEGDGERYTLVAGDKNLTLDEQQHARVDEIATALSGLVEIH